MINNNNENDHFYYPCSCVANYNSGTAGHLKLFVSYKKTAPRGCRWGVACRRPARSVPPPVSREAERHTERRRSNADAPPESCRRTSDYADIPRTDVVTPETTTRQAKICRCQPTANMYAAVCPAAEPQAPTVIPRSHGEANVKQMYW